MAVEPPLRMWSTDDVPRPLRFDYWMSVMRTALWPVTDYRGYPREFSVELNEAALGGVSILRERICAHSARRTRQDVERTQESSFHLFVSLDQAWGMEQEGRHATLRRGDVVLIGEGEHQTSVTAGFDGVILKCPASWLRTWLPEPEKLTGRALMRESRWGRVLSQVVSQITPRFAVSAPLPATVIADQVGALLALNAGDVEAQGVSDQHERIVACVRERCTELLLDAATVAVALNIPVALVHRALAARQTTFVSILLDARVEHALALLGSPSGAGMSVGEIGRLCGFGNAPHFARVLRRRTGRSVSDLRRFPPTVSRE